LSKKNTYSLSISKRSPRTNQVSGTDKIARISDLETTSLQAIGAKESLKEFLGPRADDSGAKADMYKDINLYGYVNQKDLKKEAKNKQTLNTVSQYLKGAGLDNNLVELSDIKRMEEEENK
jgi:hypothetical protein